MTVNISLYISYRMLNVVKVRRYIRVTLFPQGLVKAEAAKANKQEKRDQDIVLGHSGKFTCGG